MASHRTIFYGLIGGLIFLSSCANVPTPSTRIPALSSSPMTLTLWHTQTGIAATTLTAMVGDFQKTYPNTTIRIEPKANEGDLLREGLARIALNDMPDLVIADPRTLAEFAQRNA